MFGTAEFQAEYQAAVTGRRRQGAPAAGTLAWLIDRYRETTVWPRCPSATRRQRENIFMHVIDVAGRKPLPGSTGVIEAGRERRAETPAQARNFLDAMRGSSAWALDAQHVKADPTSGVKNPRAKKATDFVPWTEETCRRLRGAVAYRHKAAGMARRAALHRLAPRRRGAVRPPACPDGIGRLKTEKSGVHGQGHAPDPAGAAATLGGRPLRRPDLHRRRKSARPLTKEFFGNLFRAACRAAGVPGSAHGVRKIAATRAAEERRDCRRA